MGDAAAVGPMSGLVRRVVIFAAVDGLILQPHDQRSQRTVPELQIRYTTNGSATVRAGLHSDLAHLASLEAHGIVGCRPYCSNGKCPADSPCSKAC